MGRGGAAARRLLSLRLLLLSGLGTLLFVALLTAAVLAGLWLTISGVSGRWVALVVTLASAYAAVFVLVGDALLVRLVLRPIERMVEGAERIASGDDAFRLQPEGSREIGHLVASINTMAGRLICNQEDLACNIRSLNDTNRALTRARNELVQAEKLATLGVLAAGIAHEVGNPLNAILGYVEVARRKGEAGSEWLEGVRSEAQRIDRIVCALLDYARPKSAAPRHVEVNATIRETVDLLRLQGRLKDLEVDLDLASEGATVRADPAQLQQVLVNLVLNACDAIEDAAVQGRIDIVTSQVVRRASMTERPVRRQSDPAGVDYSHLRRFRDLRPPAVGAPSTGETAMVRIAVRDNGVGIAPEALGRVFDPFFTTKETGRGTGLGLAVSAKLVESMDGTIEAENRSDRGATFTVFLPITTEKNPA